MKLTKSIRCLLVGLCLLASPFAYSHGFRSALVTAMYTSPDGGLYVATLHRPNRPELLIWGHVGSGRAYRLPIRHTANDQTTTVFRLERQGTFEVLNPQPDSPAQVLVFEWQYRKPRFSFSPAENHGSQLSFDCAGQSACWQLNGKLGGRLSEQIQSGKIEILPPTGSRRVIYGLYEFLDMDSLLVVEGPDLDPQDTELKLVTLHKRISNETSDVLAKEHVRPDLSGPSAGVKLRFRDERVLVDDPRDPQPAILDNLGGVFHPLRRIHGFQGSVPVTLKPEEAATLAEMGYVIGGDESSSPCAQFLEKVTAALRVPTKAL